MAKFVNVAAPQDQASNSMGFLLGVIMLIVFILALFYFGLPLLRSATRAPQVNIPDKVDVNVNQNPAQ